ncbi:MAG: acyl-CoA dehydrogenase family protein [Gammaproteobacteria bacterium]|nr:acyl-CoA dehydrogenase family protein [Gammaproteobacteria bacterium]MBU0787418.1 acyl-CoA dehydrogenase family protein [Gammaproteobacteria bacterium]MBU0815112.1 acyl-CoA dehydrogenase family protein [Gammaproteobacteria bacterium]MBU1785780.1 acyl-CoA dehydrogenase family protein [Gammaproteobacteria bacterium]
MSANTSTHNPKQVDELADITDAVTRFAQREIAPHVSQWDDAGEFPRALYAKAAGLGLLALGYPEALGGVPASWRLRNAMTVALCRHGGSGGVLASLFSHNIGLPPVLAHGSAALQQAVVPAVLRGDKIAALAITEPGGGSDVAALRTTARREGSDYVIDGEKVFITSGMRADYLTVAVRTGDSKGASGISMILVPGDAPGLSRTALRKMGWHCSDTAQLRFDGVRVPAANLLGEEGSGFKIIMNNFNGERMAMSAAALGFAQACFDEALDWARQRKTFGQALVERQVIRHKLVDMQMRIASTQAWVEQLANRADAGDAGPDWVANVCMLKNHATQTMQFCADQAVQILGGMGYMQGTKSERIYREVKVMMIGGGAEEIMKDLAARQLGL